MLLEKIEGLLKEVSTVTAQSAEDVERLRLKYLSKKGEINALMGEFRNVAADQKRAVGIKINELKQLAQSRINALKEQVEDQAGAERRHRPDAHALSRDAGYAPSADAGEKRDYRHILPYGFHAL